jgi:hypothetical protein
VADRLGGSCVFNESEPRSEVSANSPMPVVSDFAIALTASGSNELVLNQGFLRVGEDASRIVGGLANCAVMGGKGSMDGNGLFNASRISRPLAMR